jgi:hypothetical protein
VHAPTSWRTRRVIARRDAANCARLATSPAEGSARCVSLTP